MSLEIGHRSGRINIGKEVKTDANLGFMRWLTVGPPGDDREILLEKPGAPVMDDASAAQVRDLLTKGRSGGHLFFQTDDFFVPPAALPDPRKRLEGAKTTTTLRVRAASEIDAPAITRWVKAAAAWHRANSK